jgi:UDP-N-acetylmuramate: L-alanyl-gamma-D-glutamyl-meso-diaminopimelate ligase
VGELDIRGEVIKMNLPGLNSLKKVHIIGVCGTLMGAFASYLQRRGVQVSGSDQNVYPPMSDVLMGAGVQLLNGYRAENLQALGSRPDLVVIGNVIRSDNPEARAAIEGGYVYTSLPEAMEKLLLPKTRNLVVAGTHGKTTTSSLLAHVLSECRQDPSYFIGGVSQDLPQSFYLSARDFGRDVGGQRDDLKNSSAWIGDRGCFVLEGDEYDTAFWDKVPKFNHYLPDDVILTSVEFDHADIYADLAAVVKAFQGLVSRIRPNGRLISCFDYATVRELTRMSPVPVLTYGAILDGGARFTVRQVQVSQGLTTFSIFDGETQMDQLTLQISGTHNLLNALAVWIQTRELGLDQKKVSNAFRSFRGVKRRQEVRGEPRGVLVIDDFAHHPTAVRETLRGLRLKYPGRRLITVFEPRSATSRRKVFQQDYVQAFEESDLVWISSPFDQSRIALNDQFSSEALVSDLKTRGKNAYLFESVDSGVSDLARVSQKGDLVAVLSNGGFDGFISKFLKALE